MKTPHTATFRGKRVRVVLKTGETFIDRFITRTPGKWVEFQQHGRVRSGDIKAFSNYRSLQQVGAHRK